MSTLSIHAPSIKKVVDWCIVEHGESAKKLAPKDVRTFILSLARPSPVCAVLPPSEDMERVLDQMMATDVKQEPQLLESLQTLSPVLFDLVKNVNFRDGSLPPAFNDLIKDMWKMSCAPFWHDDGGSAEQVQIDEVDSFLEDISVWPHLPKVRNRGAYAMDRTPERQSCRKQGKSHKSLLPGTVTLHCQHGRN